MPALLLLLMLVGCAHAPVSQGLPIGTQASCEQIRDFFQKVGVTSTISEDMNAGCHMRLTAESRRGPELNRQLEANGWVRDMSYSKGAVPNQFAYETPSTRCSIDYLHASGSSDDRMSGGVGVFGGSHVGTSVGLGIHLGGGGGGELLIDYKIDCVPNPLPPD